MNHPAAALLSAALLLAPAVQAADKSEGFSAGLSVHPRASPGDIGLPAYPGAVPARDGDNDEEGASIQLWGGAFGMQLHVLKLRSADSAEAVGRFYREAMARQGRLVDCSAGAPPEPAEPGASQGELLRCGKDRGKPGGHLYKIGLPGGVRMVVIEPEARGTKIQLLRLMLRGG